MCLVKFEKLVTHEPLYLILMVGVLMSESASKRPDRVLIAIGYLGGNTKTMSSNSTHGGGPSDPTFPPLGCTISGFDGAISG